MQTDKAPEYSVPLETAQQWVTNWIDANTTGKTLDPTDMRAFLVHREDFIELLQQYDTEFIRMYMGRKENNGTIQNCLVLVSATYEGDINPDAKNPNKVVDLIGKVNFVGQQEPHNYLLYDFSRPCPPDCDPESPLFIGQADERCQ